MTRLTKAAGDLVGPLVPLSLRVGYTAGPLAAGLALVALGGLGVVWFAGALAAALPW